MRGHDPDFFFVLMWTPLSLSSGVDSAVKRICLGGKDPLEKEMATRTSILCLEKPMERGAWPATVHGVARVRHDLVTKPPPPPPH